MANAVNKAASFAAKAEKTKSEAKLNAYRQAVKHLKAQQVEMSVQGLDEEGHLYQLFQEAMAVASKKKKSKKG